MNALVLLGYSKSGKDTIANLLSQKYVGVVNAKFSLLTKEILSRLFKVPVSMMEDRQWRSTALLEHNGQRINLTPMDLLTALFHGAPKCNLGKANVAYTLQQVQGLFPVFTDVRRLYEWNAILEHYRPLVILLENKQTEEGENDGEIKQVWEEARTTADIKSCCIEILPTHTPETTFAQILNILSVYGVLIDDTL